MPNKFLKLSVFLLLILTLFNLSTFAGTDSYDNNLSLIIKDPYKCGENITGKVIGDNPPIEVMVDLVRNNTSVKTYTFPNLKSGQDFTVKNPHKDVDPGEYKVFFVALDSQGNAAYDEYNAKILPPEKCPILKTVRSGASKFIKKNTIPLFFGVLATASTGLFIFKNKKMEIQR
jgi:hypothetical protein